MLYYSYTQTFSVILLYCWYSYCVLFCALLDGVCLSGNKRITYLVTYLLTYMHKMYCIKDRLSVQYQRIRDISLITRGVRRRGLTGLKPPPKLPRKKLFTHSHPEHFMYRNLYKEVSFTIILITLVLRC